MSYIKDNLMPNEKVLYSAQVNPAIFIPTTVFFVLTIFSIFLVVTTKDVTSRIMMSMITIFIFLLTARLAIEATIIMLTTELAITNKRVIAKTGFIHRNTVEILLPKIESVKVNQNILGRVMNFGTVTITGTGGTKESFKAIIDPMTTRKKVNQIIEHYAQVKSQPVRE